jgi:putative transposase
VTDKQPATRPHVYRLNPTPEQAARLAQWVGTVRFVYNLALEQRQTFWRPGRRFNYISQGAELKELRQLAPWLADVPRNALDQALRDLDGAYRAWWAGRARAPRNRRRGANDAFRLKGDDFALRRTGRRAGRLRLPKIGELKCVWDLEPRGERRSVTITRRAGKWYACVWYREEREAPAPSTLPPVGIDRGVNVFAALSTGQLIAGPNVGRKAARALMLAQRRLSRKVKGSQNYRKQRLRVARLHARVSAARADFLHKTSTAIAKSHGLVVLEDLKVRNMTASARGTVEAPGRNVRQKAGLNRAILDQGWGMFRTMLAYKLEDRGGHLLTVDPKDTSRTCHVCGVVDADSREGTRFSCRSCGFQAHADWNAAVNILRRGTPSMPAEGASAPGETGTGSGAVQ